MMTLEDLALGRKNYLFCGNHDAAVCAAIEYSLFASCKAHDVEIRPLTRRNAQASSYRGGHLRGTPGELADSYVQMTVNDSE